MRSEGFFTYSRSAYTNFLHEERKMRRLFFARRAYSTHFTRRVVKKLFQTRVRCFQQLSLSRAPKAPETSTVAEHVTLVINSSFSPLLVGKCTNRQNTLEIRFLSYFLTWKEPYFMLELRKIFYKCKKFTVTTFIVNIFFV